MPGAGAWGPARTEAVRRKEAPAAAAEGQSVWPEQDGQGQRGRRPAAGARGHRDSEAGGGSPGFMRACGALQRTLSQASRGCSEGPGLGPEFAGRQHIKRVQSWGKGIEKL